MERNGILPIISIILPSLNSVDYIEECLQSIVNQTLKDIEILCVDAYSTDGTLEILKEFAKNDNRIKIIPSDKKSLGYQINLGLENAQGEYFTIVESDDYARNDMCEVLLDLAKTHECEVVKADIIGFYNSDLKKLYKNLPICHDENLYGKVLSSFGIKKHLIEKGWNMNQSGIYSLDFVRKFGIKANETLGASYQDLGFWFQIISLAKTVYFHGEGLYFYRQDNSNSSVYSKEKVYCICDEYAFIEDFLKKHLELKDELWGAFLYKKFKSYHWNLNRIDEQFKLEFLHRFAKDFRPQLENLDKNIFSKGEIKELQKICKDPEKFYKFSKTLSFRICKKIARLKKKLRKILR